MPAALPIESLRIQSGRRSRFMACKHRRLTADPARLLRCFLRPRRSAPAPSRPSAAADEVGSRPATASRITARCTELRRHALPDGVVQVQRPMTIFHSPLPWSTRANMTQTCRRRWPFTRGQLQAVFAKKGLALPSDCSLVAGVRCARSQCRCRVQTPIAVTCLLACWRVLQVEKHLKAEILSLIHI